MTNGLPSCEQHEIDLTQCDSYPPPEPTGLTQDDISKFAEEVAKYYDFVAPISCIENLVITKLNGRIKYDNIGASDGSLYVLRKKVFTIILSPWTSPLRDQFTIAHELGHYFLHAVYRDSYPIKAARISSNSNRVEWEANWFAGSFLMPKDLFVQTYEKYGDINPVSRFFGVSQAAAKVRAQVLKII